MLPQDERDPDSNALFLQGLVMVHYVRSPRCDKAFQIAGSGSGSGSGRGGAKGGATAEARDTSLEVRHNILRIWLVAFSFSFLS